VRRSGFAKNEETLVQLQRNDGDGYRDKRKCLCGSRGEREGNEAKL
jgi:hypothetical protein